MEMINILEVLLGFQLRKTLDPKNRVWDSDNRASYLLREDISIPLSVDEAVWPACEDTKLLSSLFSDYSPEPYSAPNGLSVYCSVSPAALYRPSMHNGAFLIAITVVNYSIDRAGKLRAKHFINDTSYSIEQLRVAGWECIGYDVANDWLLSGLMNCGYEISEKELLVQKFASSLNKSGLFTSIEDAQSFRIDCDSRVPEHAPFAVYGIWANGIPV